MNAPIAVFSFTNTVSIQIMECNDEYVCYLDTIGDWHKAKLYFDTNRVYFKYCAGFRIHLDECMFLR